jgi:3alpha(or 20beta)-hydroxysteroid dehydrogenase
MGRLQGKVALISGAARGQGEAEARRFVEEGAKVVLGDVLDDLGAKVADDLGAAAAYVHLDVTQQDQWDAAVATTIERFGRIDVLVNNAGILRLGSIEEMPLDEYMQIVTINQVGCFLGMKAVIPSMKAAGSGSIINTSSTSGFAGMPLLGAYTASKFAIRGMTKVAAMELGHYGVRVNSVHPGGIDTTMTDLPDFDHIDKNLAYSAQPIPRIGKPIEVAHLMVFLASDESSFCTGAEYMVDGGFLAGPPVPGMEA